ncbi:MAG: extracellular solute-binding protein, partial [Gemmatimonadetes bacterium]|nr:extracellular solute-binding protein [Gemmatimonadota bacterium]
MWVISRGAPGGRRPLILLTTALWACGGGGPGSDDAARVALWAGGYELDVERRVIEAYERENPGTRVVLESAPTGYEERLLTSITSGHPPDVFLMDGPDIPTFVDRGLAVDLAPYLDELGFDSEQVFPQVLEA